MSSIHKPSIPKSLWGISIMCFFWSMSSFMIFGLLPTFLIDELKTSKTQLGFLEGCALFFAFLAKIVFGVMSDRLCLRKPIIMMGTIGSFLVKFFFITATHMGHIFMARFLDRFFKGIRASPTDALISDWASHQRIANSKRSLMGSFYGIRQAFYSLGNVIGGGLAALLMSLSHQNYRLVFMASLVPALCACLILFFCVEEAPSSITQTKTSKWQLSDIFKLPKEFWGLLGLSFLLYFGARFSTAFLNLRAKECMVSVSYLPLLFSLFELTFSLSSWPFGYVSDRLGKHFILSLGMGVLMLCDWILFKATTPLGAILGVLLWGVHLGMSEGILAATIAQLTPSHLKASAFGLFYGVTGVALLLSNTLAGFLSDTFNSVSVVFLASFCMGLVILGIILFKGPFDFKE